MEWEDSREVVFADPSAVVGWGFGEAAVAAMAGLRPPVSELFQKSRMHVDNPRFSGETPLQWQILDLNLVRNA